MGYRLLPLTLVCLVLFGGSSKPSHLVLINRLDEAVQARFRTALPGMLGMSRILIPNSMGQHFQPVSRNERDFLAENANEQEIVRQLEDEGLQVGFYVFGRAVAEAPPDALNFRALKGPGAITRGTPRPVWYPGLPPEQFDSAGALPDWKSIYPLAKRAMESFKDGGAGFETSLQGWDIAARPVISDQRCQTCHLKASVVSGGVVNPKEPIGGVLYAFRSGDR
jgi:hypothetical protein